MRKTTRTALVAAAFIASMNLNACAYGPEYYDDGTDIPPAAADVSDDKYDPENDIQQCESHSGEFQNV